MTDGPERANVFGGRELLLQTAEHAAPGAHEFFLGGLSAPPQPFAAGQRSLFRDSPAEQRQDIEQLAERLQARLGRDAIRGVTGIADHRPEYSWRPRALDERPDCTALAHRPAWLLPEPQRCDIARYRILAGPERIESGWWDGRDCRRDYFIVCDAAGSTLWAFHEYKPRRGWFVHGVFG